MSLCKCVATDCPLAYICLRKMKKPTDFQSYFVGSSGHMCEYFIPEESYNLDGVREEVCG